MKEIFIDAILDAIKLIPFLFLSFIIMELIEHKFSNHKKISKMNKYGPLAGSLLGIIPQCGFAALASNLYSARVITLGTLFSIYLSSSDEMLPILISNKASSSVIISILLTKFVIGFLFGLLVDIIYRPKKSKNIIDELCQKDECHCEDGIVKSSIKHTLKITIFILIINILLNSVIDREAITNFAEGKQILSPILTSLIGLIPNCASSIIITELYLEKVISLGSCLSGLLSGSGVGLLILFKQNKNIKENLIIVGILVVFSSLCGIIFNIIQ